MLTFHFFHPRKPIKIQPLSKKQPGAIQKFSKICKVYQVIGEKREAFCYGTYKGKIYAKSAIKKN